MKERIRTNRLIKLLHKSDPSYHEYEYEDFLDNFIEVITKLTAEDNEVQINNFGVFTTRITPAKISTHPRTGERVSMPESRTLKFVTSITFQEMFKKLYKEHQNANTKPTED